MRGEKGISSGNVASFEDFKNRRVDSGKPPAFVSELKNRGPYGYGGGPRVISTSDSSFDSSKFGETAKQQRRLGYRNSIYERQKQHIPKPAAATDPKVLPFNREPKNH